MAASRLENPFEEQQVVILNRIMGHVEQLNEGLLELTKSLTEVNNLNQETAQFASMYAAYTRNMQFNSTQNQKAQDSSQ